MKQKNRRTTFYHIHLKLILTLSFIVLITVQSPAASVLWDTSHGVYYDYYLNDSFSSLVENLGMAGFTVSATSEGGFLSKNLNDYDIAVVSLASAWFSSYTSVEAEAIRYFVYNGGGLLIMGDNSGCPNSNLEPIASLFGISLGMSNLQDSRAYITMSDSHQILNGINQVYMQYAGEIASTAGLTELAWEEVTGKAVLVAGNYGNGRIVAIGDTSPFDNEFYTFVDNKQFSINTFNYLVPEPATLLLVSIGAVMTNRRK